MFKIDVYNVTLEHKARGATTNYNRNKKKKTKVKTQPLTSHLCRQSCVSPNTYIKGTGVSSGTSQVLLPFTPLANTDYS